VGPRMNELSGYGISGRGGEEMSSNKNVFERLRLNILESGAMPQSRYYKCSDHSLGVLTSPNKRIGHNSNRPIHFDLKPKNNTLLGIVVFLVRQYFQSWQRDRGDCDRSCLAFPFLRSTAGVFIVIRITTKRI
jgi:hypothetical protein